MEIKVKYGSSIPYYLGGMAGITLYPYVFIIFPETDPRTPTLLKHEMVHVEQIQRVGVFKFYLTYFIDYVINLFKYRNHQQAYLNIPYEVEAYKRQEE
jgi:hypothetical protein